jgi:hypothetical protein
MYHMADFMIASGASRRAWGEAKLTQVASASSSASSTAQASGAVDSGDMSVLLSGKRLQISADVDAEGLAKLKDILTKYEEILKMLQ